MAESLHIKRAGAMLGGYSFKERLPHLLRVHEIERLRINVHEDCGALNLVMAGIMDSTKVEKDIYEALVPPFIRYISNPSLITKDMVEHLAVAIQRNIASSFANRGDLNLTNLKCTKVPTLGKVEGEKTLLLIPPIVTTSLEAVATATVRCMDPRCRDENDAFDGVVKSLELALERTYIVTLLPAAPNEMVIDAKAAVKYLNINKVALYSGGRMDKHGVIDNFYDALQRKDIELPLPASSIKRYD